MLRARDVTPMLAERRDHPFNRKGWLFEPKVDGWRVIAAKENSVARLVSRNGVDLTERFPELADALSKLPFGDVILDGEITCQDAAGKPNFEQLQRRAQLKRPDEARRAALASPATCYVFDLLAVEGHDLRELPLVTRKELLRDVLPPAGPLRYLEHFEGQGVALYHNAVAMGLEGVMAKRAASTYRMRRSADWLKIRATATDDFAIVGMSRPGGSRSGFGALHLAACIDGTFRYVGRVGTGFSEEQLRAITAELSRHRRETWPCEGTPPKDARHLWVDPTLVAEVKYKELTRDGRLRQPVFVRLREDKPPDACGRATFGKPFALSHTSKVFWPAEGYTKGDLIEYYRAIAPWLLPYLKDRPLVLTRYPDGIAGKSFFQKNAPSYAKDFVRTVAIAGSEGSRALDYIVCDTAEQLVYIANMGAIPLHVWGSRVATLETPDWCILDLDPKGAPFTDVVSLALTLKKLCDDLLLPAYVKTSGGTGLHVLIPLGRQLASEQARALAGLIAQTAVTERPEIATTARSLRDRQGKVYVDWLQNARGQLLVAPFSARATPEATVSMPLEWKEVNARLDLRRYTIKTAPALMARRGRDPMRPVIDAIPDLTRALGRLRVHLERSGSG